MAAEREDPELVALPAPPRGRRLATMTLMALVVAAAIALLMSLRADIGYFFAADTVVDLGDVNQVDHATLVPNTFVQVTGTPMASRTVHYSRPLSGSAEYAVFPLAGQRTIFVQVPVESRERARTLARRQFSGRLVTFGQLGGRFGAVRGYLEDQLGMPVSSESFLVMADEPPGSYAWALGLAGLCILFILLDAMMLWRWFRPLPAVSIVDEDDPEAEAA